MHNQFLKLSLFAATAFGVVLLHPGSHPAHAEGAAPRPLSVWGDYLAGYHAEATGDNRTALMFYETAMRKGITPTADLYSRMYVMGLTEGTLDKALVSLDKAEQLDGKAPLAALTRAVRALRDGDFEGAEALMASDDSGIARILSPVLTAWARVGRKDMRGALDALDASGSPEPQTSKDGEPEKTSPLHLLHGALINDLAGNTDAANGLYQQLRDASGLSVRTAQLLGEHFERAGQIDAARQTYQALGDDAEGLILLEAMQKRLDSGSRPALDVDSAQKGAAEALYGVASALLSQSAWESAIALSYMATALHPDSPPSLMVAASALQQNARRADANALYGAIAPASPFSWMARLNMADNLDHMGQTDKAVKMLGDMAKERPALSRPLIQLGDILRRHERFKEAADAYTRALTRIGEPDSAHWVVFYSRGIAHEQTDHWDKAEADFLRALDLNPDQPLALNYLGYSWLDKGLHLDRALKMIEKAVEQRPRDGYIVDSLGWGLYRLGDFKAAVKHLERAVMLRPADPVINDHLGDALWHVGRTREARFQWERALSMKPDADLIKVIETKLKSGLAAAQP